MVADTLLLSRYLVGAADRVSRVVFCCDVERNNLLSRSFPNISFVSDAPELDATSARTASLMALPGLLGIESSPETQEPYLRMDDARVAAIRARCIDKRLHVGLCWQGFDDPLQRNHAMHLSRLLPILGMEQIQCVSLQNGVAAEQAHALPAQFRLQSIEVFAGAACADMDQLAAVIGALDLVIAVGGEYQNFRPVFLRMGWNSFGQ